MARQENNFLKNSFKIWINMQGLRSTIALFLLASETLTLQCRIEIDVKIQDLSNNFSPFKNRRDCDSYETYLSL